MTIRIRGQRRLKTPPGHNTRPTTAKVRAAIFNIWQSSVGGCRWLDLCSGSGAMGAEALVRGASSVVGIEQSPGAWAVIRENWHHLAQPDQRVEILRGDVCQVLPRLAGQQFDHIYFDPPYNSHLYLPVLELVAGLNLLAPEGEIAVECRSQHLPDLGELPEYRQKVYGSTTIILIKQF